MRGRYHATWARACLRRSHHRLVIPDLMHSFFANHRGHRAGREWRGYACSCAAPVRIRQRARRAEMLRSRQVTGLCSRRSRSATRICSGSCGSWHRHRHDRCDDHPNSVPPRPHRRRTRCALATTLSSMWAVSRCAHIGGPNIATQRRERLARCRSRPRREFSVRVVRGSRFRKLRHRAMSGSHGSPAH